MRPAIVLILRFPGTGKFTVAKELVSSLDSDEVPARLIDNHTTANVLFHLIAEADGKTRLPKLFWKMFGRSTRSFFGRSSSSHHQTGRSSLLITVRTVPYIVCTLNDSRQLQGIATLRFCRLFLRVSQTFC